MGPWQLGDEAAGDHELGLAVARAYAGIAECTELLGSCDADVEESALLFDHLGRVEATRGGEEVFLYTCDVDVGEL